MSFNSGRPGKRQRGDEPFQNNLPDTLVRNPSQNRAASTPAQAMYTSQPGSLPSLQPPSIENKLKNERGRAFYKALTRLRGIQAISKASSMAQSKIKSDRPDMQGSNASPAGNAKSRTLQAGPSEAEATRDVKVTQDAAAEGGVTPDGARQIKASDTGKSQTPMLTPIEISPLWKTAMACVSVAVGWSPNQLETAYGEIASKKTGEEIGAFTGTGVRGPPVGSKLSTSSDGKGVSAWVHCSSANPSYIRSISFIKPGEAAALTKVWVTKASVEHVLSRNSQACSLWLDGDADGYLCPCCEDWYACVDFTQTTTALEAHAFLLWVLDKDAGQILADRGVSDKRQAKLWQHLIRYSKWGRARYQERSGRPDNSGI
ncbi:hypothetical protein GGTG_14049 [Gaeumannomyces tritici R3-111a-1]|uniref:Uncharacterized protein n=1 Tax=Gaeumannomyces tritici (strain R3-111a-1) TaxID=644352 RepID=J3PKJ3_GAET3|nr:hypothetical protein GGTG_14049 [Gaeumannomyces tritici R3-111a-1]EJT68372.1 hypothetical protein GGTG_14049 [Gaeumannomyces tritici R3-111a-1]